MVVLLGLPFETEDGEAKDFLHRAMCALKGNLKMIPARSEYERWQPLAIAGKRAIAELQLKGTPAVKLVHDDGGVRGVAVDGTTSERYRGR